MKSKFLRCSLVAVLLSSMSCTIAENNNAQMKDPCIMVPLKEIQNITTHSRYKYAFYIDLVESENYEFEFYIQYTQFESYDNDCKELDNFMVRYSFFMIAPSPNDTSRMEVPDPEIEYDLEKDRTSAYFKIGRALMKGDDFWFALADNHCYTVGMEEAENDA